MKWLGKALLMLVLSLVYLAILELAVRWLWPQDSEIVYLATQPPGQEDPVLGHVLKADTHYRSRTPEFEAEYRTNSQGLRDAATYAVPKPPGVTRILLLGDSFTYGAASDYEEIWPVVLEEDLRARGHAIELVKAGVPAYDTAKEVLLLEQIFDRYQPDAVAVTFLPNDLFTNTRIGDQGSGLSGELARDVVRAKRARGVRMLHTLSLARRLAMGSDLLYTMVYAATARGQYYAAAPDEEVRDKIAITQELLIRGQTYCRDRGADFLVISLPQQFQVLARAAGRELEGLDVDHIDRVFEAFAEERGMPWIVLLPELAERYAAEGEDLYYRFDGHLTSRGNRVVAELLGEALSPLLTGATD